MRKIFSTTSGNDFYQITEKCRVFKLLEYGTLRNCGIKSFSQHGDFEDRFLASNLLVYTGRTSVRHLIRLVLIFYLKLGGISICDSCLRCLESYFQFVLVQRIHSNIYISLSGVPQWSHLGAVFFIMS